ncbi:MAG: tetratricopeptide repeat protein, partial [Acidobacteriia bacterium]|nr:tetratricopeptide repeat protein [Terriglobia bacterium]
TQSVRETGEQLGAEYILNGSVQRAGQNLRINARVIRVRDEVTVWSKTFDRPLTDVFAIQDEISLGIVNSLRLSLGSGRRRYETSVEAYDFYLRARASIIQRGVGGYDASIHPFEQAIAKDAAFAPAYAGLAAARVSRSGRFRYDQAEEMIKMRAAAQTAAKLDPLLPEAHEALGMVYARDGQWEQSEKSFRRAIELGGGRSSSYDAFAVYLLWPLGRTEEALKQLRFAENTDPLSPEVHSYLSMVLTSLRRYDEAAGYCDKLPAAYPSRNVCLAQAQFGRGKVGEAIQILEPAYRRGLVEGSPILSYLGCAYARTGRRGEAEKIAAVSSFNPFNQAAIFACLGDKDRTFESLDRAAVVGPFRMGRILTSPEYDLLRGDPRLAALRNRVGLPL